jgi:hypothetical protein
MENHLRAEPFLSSHSKEVMARQIVFTPNAAKPPPAYSQAVKAAGLVFVSGTAPTDLPRVLSRAQPFKNKPGSPWPTFKPSSRQLAVR